MDDNGTPILRRPNMQTASIDASRALAQKCAGHGIRRHETTSDFASSVVGNNSYWRCTKTSAHNLVNREFLLPIVFDRDRESDFWTSTELFNLFLKPKDFDRRLSTVRDELASIDARNIFLNTTFQTTRTFDFLADRRRTA